MGDRKSEIKKVALALDPTVKAVKQAHKLGANVLLTHHPAYIEAPQDFFPGDSVAKCNGALVYQAVYDDVALMNFQQYQFLSKNYLKHQLKAARFHRALAQQYKDQHL